MEDVPFHNHDGVNSPKISQNNVLDTYTASEVVLLTTDQTVAGVKTFSSIPVLPASDPTTDNQAVRKYYVDNLIPDFVVEASDNLRDSADAQKTTSEIAYTKVKEIQHNEASGTIRVKFDLSVDGAVYSAYGRIYVNGVAVGTERSTSDSTPTTYSEDIDVEQNDLVQLYSHKTDEGSDAEVQFFRLYFDKVFGVTPGEVIMD